MEFGILNWSIIGIYLIILIVIGLYFRRKQTSAAYFFKGGGKVPWWAAGLSIYATLLSSITYMSIPAKAYASDWTYFPMLMTIALITYPVIHYYLPFFRSLKSSSGYEYLENRFNGATRTTASSFFILFMLARIGVVLYVPSLAISTVTAVDIEIIILVVGIVTLFYSCLGGISAVIWTDVVQGGILILGALIAAILLIVQTPGGFTEYIELGREANKFRLIDWSYSLSTSSIVVVVLGGIVNNLISLTSDQAVIQRYMTTSSEGKARKSIILNTVLSLSFSGVFYVIGTGMYTFYTTHPDLFPKHLKSLDALFPYYMVNQMPDGWAAFVFAAILAATMSTVSSNVNSAAASFSQDLLYRRWPKLQEKDTLRSARNISLGVGVFGIALAIMMAQLSIKSLVDLFNLILGVLTSGIGALFFIGIFMPRVSSRVALLSFGISTIVVFVVLLTTKVSFLFYGAIGFVCALVVAFIGQQLSPNYLAKEGYYWNRKKHTKISK